MEARFQHDFGRVRVHTGAHAAATAEALGARSFAYADEVALRAGAADAANPDLVHELAHVVQQARGPGSGDPEVGARSAERQATTPQEVGGAPVGLHLKESKEAKEAAELDAQKAVGARLWSEFSDGVTLAFFQQDNAEGKRRAQDWAAGMNAVGFGKTVTARGLAFGQAISEPTDFPALVRDVGTLLEKCAEVSRPPDKATAPLTPARIRTLAIFAHGGSSWCGMSTILSGNLPAIVKRIAPKLTEDVNVILFTCNSASGSVEDDFRGSVRPGGKESLSGIARDALLAEGLKKATVWGHADTGHVTENYRLREFRADAGKGAEGQPFLTAYGITAEDQMYAVADLTAAATRQGFELPGDAKHAARVMKEAQEIVEWFAYDAYRQTARSATLGGRKLPEATPTDPTGAGKIVKEAWKTYWPEHLEKAVGKLVKAAGLKKAKAR